MFILGYCNCLGVYQHACVCMSQSVVNLISGLVFVLLFVLGCLLLCVCVCVFIIGVGDQMDGS